MGKQLIIAALLSLFSTGAFSRNYDIVDFGAAPGDGNLNTTAIQSAIDRCFEQGGGRVVVPRGVFTTGTIVLKDRVELHLSQGAVLEGSTSLDDYPYLDVRFKSQFTRKTYYNVEDVEQRYRALIFAEAARGVKISGQGTVDGNGGAGTFQLGNDASSKASMERPILILMIDCRDVEVQDVHLTNSAYWMQNYLACDGVHIHGISVVNHSNFNNDGIDIDSRNVLVENCDIDSDDDGICLKSQDVDRYCENVIIRNCTVRTNCNAVKLGTGSLGGFRNIDISNISITATSQSNVRHSKLSRHTQVERAALAGIAIENVDGGLTDNVRVGNIFMDGVETPLFIKLGDRSSRPEGDPSASEGHMRNVIVENVRAVGYSTISSSITGYPGNPVRGVVLRNISISSPGSVARHEIPAVLPEAEGDYPENRMFGFILPASGIFIRHAEGIELDNVNFEVRREDARAEVVFDDVRDARARHLRRGNEPAKVDITNKSRVKIER
jgi:hypothetical protein